MRAKHFGRGRILALGVLAGGTLGVADVAKAQQVAATWLSASSGNWSVPGRWSTDPFYPDNGTPGGTTYAVTAPPGFYTLTLNVNATVDSINMQGGSLYIDQHALTLASGGAATLGPSGQVHLFFGTLNNAVLNLGATQTGLRIERDGNTLNNVTINGSSILADNTSGAAITNGLTLNGTLTFRNRLGGFSFSGSQAVHGGTYFFDTAVNPQVRHLVATEGSTVTFDPNVVVHGQNFQLTGPANTGMLIHQGSVSADVAGQSATISGRVNSTGTAEAINGASLTFTNNGWSSTGILRAGAGSTLNLGGQGSITGATLDTAAGTVNVIGSLDNAGGTIALGGSTGSWNLGFGGVSGTITGGTVTTAGATAFNVNSVFSALNNVAFNGQANIAPSARLSVDGGSLAGAVTVAPDATLNFLNNWTSSAQITATDAMINLGGAFSLAPGFDLQRTGGTVNFTGSLQNSGSTLRLDADTGSWTMNGASITGGVLQLRDGATLVASPAQSNAFTGVTLDGTLSLDATNARLSSVNGLSGGEVRITGAGAGLTFSNTQTLASDILFNGSAQSDARLGVEQSSTLTIADGATVHGGRALIGGGLFNNGASTIINQGSILADVAGQTLTIGGSTLSNQGFVGAQSGGTLLLTHSGNVGNVGADGAGSLLRLSGTYTLNSPIAVTDGAALTLNGAWTNAAGITLTDSILTLGGSFTTASVGTINRTNSEFRVGGTWNNANSTITLDPGAGPLVLAGGTLTGGTINGAPGATLSAAPSLTSNLNSATVNADISVAGGTLNTTGLTLNADTTLTSGATMRLNGAWSNSGSIHVDSSTLNLGGVFSFANAGSITRTPNAAVNLSGTLNAAADTVTLSPTSLFTGINNGTMNAGTLEFVDSPTLTMTGGFVRTGAITGTGVISMANNASITPPGTLPAGALTIAPGVTVRGSSGNLGQTPLLTSTDSLVNQGVIAADIPGSGITIWARNFTNEGLLEVGNNGTMRLSRNGGDGSLYTDWTNTGTMRVTSGQLFLGGRFQTADIGNVEHSGGDIIVNGALDNSNATLHLDSDRGSWAVTSNLGLISGGSIDIDAGFVLEMHDSGTLDAVTVNGNLVSDAGIIRNGLTLNGVATIPNRLAILGDQTIAAGEFNLVNGELNIGEGSAFTFASPVTVHGHGSLNANSPQALTNAGRIAADVPGQTLAIAQSTLVNTGTLEGIDGGTLTTIALNLFNSGLIRAANNGRVNLGGNNIHLAGGTLLNEGGIFNITGTIQNAGSTFTVGGSQGSIALAGGRINGGTVESANGGRLVISNDGGGQPTLDGVTLNAGMDIHRTLEIRNGLTFSQDIQPLGAAGLRFIGASNSLAGEGTLSLTGASPQSTQRIEQASGATLTIGAATAIRGGNAVISDDTGIGAPGVQNFLVNNGRITADVAGQMLSIMPDVFTNHGILEAIDGGILNLGTQVLGTGPASRTWSSDGIIRVDHGTLLLGGTFDSSGVGAIERDAGEVRLLGLMNNTGATFTLDGAEQSWIMEGGGINQGQFVGARIVGGTVDLLKGAALISPVGEFGNAGGGALEGVTVNGDITLDGALYAHNSTFNGTTTIGGGRLYVGPPGVPEPATLSSGTFVFSDGSPEFGRILNSALTLGEDVIIRGGRGEVAAIANHGLISADLPSDVLVARIGLNTGTIEAVNGGTLVLAPAGGGLVNNGTMRVIDSSLVFTGTGDVFNSITRSNASVTFDGLVDNGGSTLDLDADTDWSFRNGLYLKGGTVNISPGTTLPVGSYIAAAGPVSLDGVTINGDMLALPTSAQIDAYRGLALDGMLQMPTPGLAMTFVGDQVFSGGTLFFDATGGNGERTLRLRGLGQNGAGSATLTIAADAVVRGGDLRISTGNRASTQATVINNGLVSADQNAETIIIESPRFVNNGSVQAINGGSIVYEGPPPFGPNDPLVFENNGFLLVADQSVFEADFLQQGHIGVIELLLAGSESSDDFGRIIANTMGFDGALRVSLAGSYQPGYGDRFNLFDFTESHGAFRVLALPELMGELAWNTSSLYDDGSLSVVPAPGAFGLLAIGGLAAVRRRRS